MECRKHKNSVGERTDREERRETKTACGGRERHGGTEGTSTAKGHSVRDTRAQRGGHSAGGSAETGRGSQTPHLGSNKYSEDGKSGDVADLE